MFCVFKERFVCLCVCVCVCVCVCMFFFLSLVHTHTPSDTQLFCSNFAIFFNLQKRQHHNLLIPLLDAIHKTNQRGADGPAQIRRHQQRAGAGLAQQRGHRRVIARRRQVRLDALRLLDAQLRQRRVVEPRVAHTLCDLV